MSTLVRLVTVRTSDCRCGACVCWGMEQIADGTAGHQGMPEPGCDGYRNSDGTPVFGPCETDGCTCLAIDSDGQCEGCWLAGK